MTGFFWIAKILIAIAAFLGVNYAFKFALKYAESHFSTIRPVLPILNRILTILLVIIFGMVILQTLGVDIMPLLAFGGIGAAAIGFASKDIIANLCSGLMIYLTRPFAVGEWILLPEKNVEAIIEEIGWSQTTVRDKEKRPIYLPNQIFSQQYIINTSRMSHRRIKEKLSIRYTDFSKMRDLSRHLKQMALANPQIDTTLPVLIYFTAVHGNTIELEVDVYTKAINYEEYLAIKQEFLIATFEIINKEAKPISPHTLFISKIQE